MLFAPDLRENSFEKYLIFFGFFGSENILRINDKNALGLGFEYNGNFILAFVCYGCLYLVYFYFGNPYLFRAFYFDKKTNKNPI